MKKVPFSSKALAEFLAQGLQEALGRAPQASLGVSGGRTPEAVFPLLARADLPWERVWITLTDERWLPPDHEGSTEFLVRRLLLKDNAEKAQFAGFWRPDLSPQAALPLIEHDLRRMPWPLDVVFLGMGSDGHIASLFPGDPALAHDRLTPSHPGDSELNVNRSLKQTCRADSRAIPEPFNGSGFFRSALVADAGRVATAHGPPPYPDRVTLTLPELAQARRVGLAAQEPEKQAVLKAENKSLPIHRFLAVCNESLVIFG